MSKRHETLQRFAGFTVDPVRRRLMKNGECVAVTAKAFETLRVLIEHHGETVSKADLMNAVWPDTAVEENNLTQQISALRKALGERPDDHRFIVTVPGRGYAFVADIENGAPPSPAIKRRLLNSGAHRGYAVAFAYILLVACSFLFQTPKHSRPQSLAVVDFRTASSGDQFIGTGISDTLRARLGSVEDIVVKPGALAFNQDAVALGRDLNVEAVVTGSVQRDRDRIRVAVQMVDVSAGRIIWGKTFDRDESDVFALQDAIAVDLARALSLEISRRQMSKAQPLIPA